MIIHKETGSVETRDGFPNQNFGDYENVFVVDDFSELGEKIKLSIPYFDLVLDDNGNLIDIAPTERPPEPMPPTSLEERVVLQQEAIDFILMNF